MNHPARILEIMNNLRPTTHVTQLRAHPSGGSNPSPEGLIQQHGTMPQWTREEIAKAERQDLEELR